MSDYPTLKVGSKGAAVVHLKALLHSKGYHAESTYDRYVKATAEQVHLFQMRHLGSGGKFLVETPGVEPGVVAEETWRALDGSTPQRMGIKPAPDAGIRVRPPSRGSTRAAGDPGDPAILRRSFLAYCAHLHEDGTGERPKGSNWGDGVIAMLEHCGLGPNPWCAAAMVYGLYESVGHTLPSGKSARVCTIWNAARKAGIAHTLIEADPCPGDLFVQLHAPLRRGGYAPDVNGHIGAMAGIGGGRFDSFEGNSDDRFRAGNRDLNSIKGFIQWCPPAKFSPTKGARFQASDGSRDR